MRLRKTKGLYHARGGVAKSRRMSEITLRAADAGDVAPLSALAYASFRETFLEGFAIPYPPADLAAFVASTYDPSVMAAKLADPLQATWIIEAGGAMLAYANAGPCSLPHAQARPEHAQLNRLYALRSAQGLGLGRRLMRRALDWMADQRPGAVWLGVWSGNHKAQRFYEAYGFSKVGEYQFPVGEWLDDEFIMRRPATP